MDNLNAGGGQHLTSSGHASSVSVATPPTINMATDVTVTVGGPMLQHRGASSFSSSNNGGAYEEINLNASAIVATSSSFSSSVNSFEETKELLARHLNRASFVVDSAGNFDGIDLGGDDHTHVPLGDILEKLEESAELDDNDSNVKSSMIGDLIRLHSDHHPTISATVNVATLDLSDPDSIHQHLSQLNDTVLRVANSNVNDSNEDFFATDNSSDETTSSNPISISTSLSLSSEKTEDALMKKTTSSPATPRKSGSTKASPQSCSVCSKVFSNASALAKHRLTHSEERRYHCNICGKAFKRQDHLNGHLLTHRSTKPFACHVEGCGKSYCDARSLRRHKENHHGLAKTDTTSNKTSSQPSDNQSADSKTIMTTTTTSGPDHLISKSSGVLGDTKIKFSTKGLTAQQLQLIEQLFKQSKSKSDLTTNGDPNKQQPSVTSSSPPAAAVTSKKGTSADNKGNLPDKPVECTICSRKFKNIPALNGHMRLHGGYYKKDADGRRLMANTTSPLKTMMIQPQAKSKDQQGGTKRKLSESEQQQQASKKQQPTISVTYCQQPQQVVQAPSFAFSNLPQPDTSKLLANLEQKTKQLGSNTTTTSSLRALRKPTAAAANGTTTSNINNTKKENPPQIASLINAQPLSLPMVALPTKPLPVQQMTTEHDSPAADSSMMKSTSIQITALIQSSSCHSSHNAMSNDFVVQASTQECGSLLNNIPLVNSMLTCMQQQATSVNLHQKPSHMLKVDHGSDHTPKTGPEHQADIPDLLVEVEEGLLHHEDQEPVWHPDTANCLSDTEFNQFLCVASSCAVRGGSHNEEVALEILQKHRGNVGFALQDLLSTYDFEDDDSMSLFSSHDSDFDEDSSNSHFLRPTAQSCNRPWQPYEVDLFYEGLVRYHKDFNRVARHVGSKSVKDCVEFYYLWKNICYEESQSFKSLYSSASQQFSSADCNGSSSSNSSAEQSCLSSSISSQQEMAGPSSVSSVV